MCRRYAWALPRTFPFLSFGSRLVLSPSRKLLRSTFTSLLWRPDEGTGDTTGVQLVVDFDALRESRENPFALYIYTYMYTTQNEQAWSKIRSDCFTIEQRRPHAHPILEQTASP